MTTGDEVSRHFSFRPTPPAKRIEVCNTAPRIPRSRRLEEPPSSVRPRCLAKGSALSQWESLSGGRSLRSPGEQLALEWTDVDTRAHHLVSFSKS
jgi:hypothetical protein